ncbi:restriction endonuclease [Flavobacterium sp. MMS24-S5]|uniref:restriction endonuclease n=1 Tax=Flavobacterium sp. MMS24-S5 TaxID=3416605 RepID=UPI003D04BE23
MAKKNSGKTLEKTIKLIEETFNNSPDTKVFLSHKLICESGIEREFDVVIKSKVNGYDMCIAIECKDYGSRVSIEKIEAFKSKCSTVKEINKMVFVSALGYQRGAITQAKNFGIDLLTAEQISVAYLNELMPDISNLYIQITPKYGHRISLGSNEEINIEISNLSYESQFIEYGTKKTVTIFQLMKMTIELFERCVDGIVIKHYAKYKDSIESNSTIPVTLGMDFLPQTFYIEDENLKNVDLTRLEFDVTVSISKPESENTGRVIKNSDETIKAHSIKFKYSDTIESELILKPNNDFTFFHTENKETVEYKKLLSYDPKTEEFKNPS